MNYGAELWVKTTRFESYSGERSITKQVKKTRWRRGLGDTEMTKSGEGTGCRRKVDDGARSKIRLPGG